MIDDEDFKYCGRFKHKKDCDCGIVNPITEWIGNQYVRIIGYECPKCRVKTYLPENANG